MRSISSDAVAKMWCHQFTVLWSLGIVEHPVLASLTWRQTHDENRKPSPWAILGIWILQKNLHYGRLTEMASLVHVSMIGCNRLSNSVMSNWVSTSSFWVCCSIARAMAAVTCSYIEKKKELENAIPFFFSLLHNTLKKLFFVTIDQKIRGYHTETLTLWTLKGNPNQKRINKTSLRGGCPLRQIYNFLLVLYLSECVQMLLLLLQIPLALLDKLIDGGCSRRGNLRRNNQLHWWRRDINHVFGAWVVHVCTNNSRKTACNMNNWGVEVWWSFDIRADNGRVDAVGLLPSVEMPMPKDKCAFPPM